MRCFTLFALTAATLLQLKQDAAALDADSKEYPVTKVVNLLKDMQETLKEEMDADEKVYQKLACWCETNGKEKNAAVETAKARLTMFEGDIEEMTAKSVRLNVEINTLSTELAASQDALAKATAIREKELAEFNAEEKDMVTSIKSIKDATLVLSKHQTDAPALLNVATVLKHHMHTKAKILQGKMSPAQKQALTAFVQQPEVQGTAGPQAYTSATGGIFGVLNQMEETFEGNLDVAQKDELSAEEAFSSLKTAKISEIEATKKALDMKTVELAETDEKGAQAKENYADTEDALSADEAFLLDLKEKCSVTDKEMADRTKARQDEISAVGEAIAILTADEARDTFSSTLGFVQVNAVLNVEKKTRRDVVKILKAAAAKTKNPSLLELAAQAGIDVFAKVKESIDGMIGDIKQQIEDDVKHKDYCVEELDKNALDTKKANDDRDALVAHIDDLKTTIDTLTKDIAQKKADIAEMQVQVKRASEDREAENKMFQQTVADQRATQAILTKALDRLKKVYVPEVFAQTKATDDGDDGPAGKPPAAEFSDYNQNKHAGGVLSMIQEVITDAKVMETEAIRAENETQTNYEDFVKNTNDAIFAAQNAIVNMTESKAKAEESLETAESDLSATLSELEQLHKYAGDLHTECDFTIQNFDTRQEAMESEVEALQQAKAVLSGADFGF
jgi:hypothetical protein